MEKLKKQRKQMAFDVHPDLHREIKIIAAKRNISISLWINRVLVAACKAENRFEKE